MAYRIQGIFFILFGVVALFDSWRITQTVRPGGSFDSIGPDRYLAIVSAILVLLGLTLVLRPPSKEGAFSWNDLCRWPPADYVLVALTLAVYVWAIAVIGFSISTVLFFIVLYRLLGGWSWPRTLAYAGVTAAFVYLVFVYFSDLPMPKSMFGI